MNFWLYEQAVHQSDKVAITDGTRSLTFRQLYQQASSYHKALTQLNRSRVGLYINTSIDAVILIHACWLANIEIAMINTRLTTSEIINQMNSVEIDTIICTTDIELENFNIYHFEQLSQETNDTTPSQFNLNDIASIMFTSGTTGPQKAVPQTFSNHLASAIGCKNSLGYNEQTIWLSPLPIYHISGLSVILRSVIEGFTVRLVEKFDTAAILNIIKEEGITHVSLVPQTLKWLMDKGLTQPYTLEKILLGGAKLSAQLIDQALSYQLPIYNSFGMTETCSQFLTAAPHMLNKRYDTVGKPSDNVSVKIKNPDAQGHGELLIKGDNVMNGYLYPSNLTDTFEDGYFKTGDIAEIDAQGYVMIYDRRKDLIISGGENIYPFEIEGVAKQFEGIEDAVCVPRHDEEWGQVPILYFVASQTINLDELNDYLLQYLAKYKVPKAYFEVESLPYTSTGKLQRNKLLSQGD